MKTYIVATDVYMFTDERKLYELTAETKRGLLLELLQLTEETPLDSDEPEGPTTKSLTDAELEKLFDDANGDGQPYVQVWCVEERKQVLG